ncbi:MAG: hypothetical protein V2I56_14270 [Desulfobacteraceae bacterium]|jgi:hypothetical protein|nr:hypothetical protein [Desulfobacteraceae bacterium]
MDIGECFDAAQTVSVNNISADFGNWSLQRLQQYETGNERITLKRSPKADWICR